MPNLAADKLMLLMDAENITFSDLTQTLQKFKNLRVHVVGDTIVDSFTHCTMIGGMTKTPTMSVRHDYKQDYIGGAAIVAKHLKAAGVDVTFSTVLGDDDFKNYVLNDLEKAGIKTQAVIDATRPTTNKNAIVVGNYRLLKIDTLDNRSISEKILRQLSENIKNIPSDIVVFSDFRHGIFSKETIPHLIDAISNGVFKVADSQVASRWGNILDFKDFDLITPNEKEARFALGDQDSVIRPLGTELYKQSNSKVMILKVGERGSMVFRSTDERDIRAFFTLDTFCKNVVDPVGAGDALLAYATLSLAVSKNPVIASILGNCAAAIECEKDGNIPVFPENIIAKLSELQRQMDYSADSLSA
jgi:rfaE bifunctional protein kinase chain/domain